MILAQPCSIYRRPRPVFFATFFTDFFAAFLVANALTAFFAAFSAVVFLATAFLADFFVGVFVAAFLITFFFAGAFLTVFVVIAFLTAFFTAFLADFFFKAPVTAVTAESIAVLIASAASSAAANPIPTANPAFSTMVSSAILRLLRLLVAAQIRIVAAYRSSRVILFLSLPVLSPLPRSDPCSFCQSIPHQVTEKRFDSALPMLFRQRQHKWKGTGRYKHVVAFPFSAEKCAPG